MNNHDEHSMGDLVEGYKSSEAKAEERRQQQNDSRPYQVRINTGWEYEKNMAYLESITDLALATNDKEWFDSIMATKGRLESFQAL